MERIGGLLIDDRRMMILRNGALGRPISVSNQQSQISNHQSKHAALE
jgi:hypothetical protein